MTKVYLRTRGLLRSHDYRYFPSEPEYDWSVDAVGQLCRAEEHSVAVRLSEGALYARVTGIPSSRTDEIGTAIRFTIAVEGTVRDSSALVRALVNATAHQNDCTRLGRTLDTLVGENVNAWYLVSPSQREIQNYVRGGLKDISRLARESEGGLWSGGADNEENLNDLIERVRSLRDSSSDTILGIVNLLDNPQELNSLPRSDVGLVLVAGKRESRRQLRGAAQDTTQTKQQDLGKGLGTLIGPLLLMVGILFLLMFLVAAAVLL